MEGKLIVIEGLDGTGKTTQITRIADGLREKGYRVYTTAEPTRSETGKHIRKILGGTEPCSPWALAMLFLADRIGHNTDPADGIKKHLHNGEIVISDRYYYSTFAYQGMDTSVDWVMQAHFDCPEITKPDICVFLTMEPAQCMERILANRPNDALEIYETTEKLTEISKRFSEVFARLQNRERIVRIDASKTIEEVSKDVLQAVLPVLKGE